MENDATNGILLRALRGNAHRDDAELGVMGLVTAPNSKTACHTGLI